MSVLVDWREVTNKALADIRDPDKRLEYLQTVENLVRSNLEVRRTAPTLVSGHRTGSSWRPWRNGVSAISSRPVVSSPPAEFRRRCQGRS